MQFGGLSSPQLGLGTLEISGIRRVLIKGGLPDDGGGIVDHWTIGLFKIIRPSDQVLDIFDRNSLASACVCGAVCVEVGKPLAPCVGSVFW